MTAHNDLWTRHETADALRVSVATVDQMIRTGKLKPLSLSPRVVRIPAAQVEALIGNAMVAA